MRKDERILKEIPTSTPGKVIRVKIYYDIGGADYFAGGTRERGYYLSVTPIEKGGTYEIIGAFTGYKKLLQPAPRFNFNTLQNITPEESLIEGMVRETTAKNNLTI